MEVVQERPAMNVLEVVMEKVRENIIQHISSKRYANADDQKLSKSSNVAPIFSFSHTHKAPPSAVKEKNIYQQLSAGKGKQFGFKFVTSFCMDKIAIWHNLLILSAETVNSTKSPFSNNNRENISNYQL